MMRVVLITTFALLLSGCSEWWLDTEWEDGGFRLIAIDARSQMSLIHEDSAGSLVGPTIYAVGADDRFIVLKQHPANEPAGLTFDRGVTHFFIVGRDKSVRGPLEEAEFSRLSAELSLPAFTTVFDDLQ